LLRAIFDPQVGVALKSLHQKLEAPWTIETLACGLGDVSFRVCIALQGTGS
jgi:hypothetical protein